MPKEVPFSPLMLTVAITKQPDDFDNYFKEKIYVNWNTTKTFLQIFYKIIFNSIVIVRSLIDLD